MSAVLLQTAVTARDPDRTPVLLRKKVIPVSSHSLSASDIFETLDYMSVEICISVCGQKFMYADTISL